MDVVILVIYFVVYFEGPLEYNKKTVLIEPNLFTFIKEFVVWGVFYSIIFKSEAFL